jgi:hypothetical protein
MLFILDVDYTICITCIMYQQLWGYKVEEKLYLGVRVPPVEYHCSSVVQHHKLHLSIVFVIRGYFVREFCSDSFSFLKSLDTHSPGTAALMRREPHACDPVL